MPNSEKPLNRRSGSLWAVVTAVAVLAVLYFTFFSSREGEAPVSPGSGSQSEGSRAPVPTGAPPANQ